MNPAEIDALVASAQAAKAAGLPVSGVGDNDAPPVWQQLVPQ